MCKRWPSAWCLLLCVTGCSQPEPITVTRTVPLEPPAALLAPSDVPPPDGVESCLDLAQYAKRLQSSVQACNADKAAVRGWVEQARGPSL